MLKLKKGTSEYEVIGQITFIPNEEVEDTQTNYTIVIDGVTTTVESTDTEWEVTDVPDPVIEPEPVVEPEPLPPPVVPEPTPEEIERNAWLDNWHKYLRAKKAMDALRDADITPSPEEEAAFTALKQWVADNRKIEYVQYM